MSEEQNIRMLKQENERLVKIQSEKILLVEEGSVDENKLIELGITFITYRQGSRMPELLKRSIV